MFLLPWVSIVSICFLVSWYSLYFIGHDLLLAPILKLWLFLKPLFYKIIPALLVWLWAHTGAKLAAWINELVALLATILGGWKAWSAKKLARQLGRFFVSLSARFVALSVFLNLLLGYERRGVRLLPRLFMHRLGKSGFGRVLHWWKASSERKKRLVLGCLLCVILVVAGQTVLGVSILLFDLVWEILLLLWRGTLHCWRLLAPFVLKLVPNFMANFFTNKLLPLAADLIPVIKDDHRIIYLRFNIRRHIRSIKAWLYLKSRARRHSVRERITPLVNDRLRARKNALLGAAARLRKKRENRDETKPYDREPR